MNEQQRKDLERITELRMKIWGKVAKNLMLNEDNPYELSTYEIECHEGRLNKALRLLSEDIECVGTRVIEKYWGKSKKITYKVKTFEKSQKLGIEPKFTYELARVHDILFQCDISNQYDINFLCYQETRNLNNEQAIYVYWHKNEFDILFDGKVMMIYPIALLETRMKAIMRSIVEQYLHTNFNNYIETLLGLKEGTINKEDHYCLEIRNFAAYGHRFTPEQYFGTYGFLEEYTHFRDYFQALINKLNELNTLITNKGGYASIIKKYRIDIITLLLKNAPLYIFNKIPKNNFYISIPFFENPFLNTFILQNSGYLNYDVLYSDDTEILYIYQDNICIHNEKSSDTTFTHRTCDLKLISKKGEI